MLTLLKSYNLITEKLGRFYLTELAQEHLVDSAEWCLEPYIASQKNRSICLDMLKVLQTGEPISWGAEKDENEWAIAMEKEEFAESFTSAMDSRGAYLAPAFARSVDFSEYSRLLDIGGASGIYSAAVVQIHKHMTASVLEKPPVDKATRYSVNKREMADRVSVIAGDMFKEDLPKGFDVHIYSNVLHDWDTDDVKILLKKSYDSLLPEGILLIHDAHLNAEKTGPIEIAEYSVLLMSSTRGKCHSVKEMEDMLIDAGFLNIEVIQTVGKRSVIKAKKNSA
ncbi:MAG: methyltransferase domain-containing protein [Methanobrevibacter sp.]|nr:methyltransferase domain-containing protein [Methanobrevibacter sp.]